MRPSLVWISTIFNPDGSPAWVLLVPPGGGGVEAVTLETAQRGQHEGWIEGLPAELVPADLPPAGEGLAQAAQTQPESDRYDLYVNADRTMLVRFWGTGAVEFCERQTPHDTWGPPVALEREEVSGG